MARRKKSDSTTTTTTRQREKGNFLSDEAMSALESGTYGQKYGRKAQSFSSQDQAKIANPLPVLDGVLNSPTYSTPEWESRFSNAKQYQQNLENEAKKYQYNDVLASANTLDKKDQGYLQRLVDRFGDGDLVRSSLFESKKDDWEQKYGKSIDQIYSDFIADQGNAKMRQGQEHSILSTLAATLGEFGKPLQAIPHVVSNLIDPDSEIAKGSEKARAEYSDQLKRLKAGVKENLGDTGDKVYDTATQVGGRMLLNTAGNILGGPLGAGILTGLADYSDQMDVLNLRPDMDNRKKAATALAHGAVEGAGNAITRGMLDGLPTVAGVGGKLINVGKGAGNAAIENSISEAVEMGLDTLINGENSERELNKAVYMLQGMTEDEAERQVQEDQWGRVKTAAGTGAAFGGFTKGLGEAFNSIGNIPALKNMLGNTDTSDVDNTIAKATADVESAKAEINNLANQIPAVEEPKGPQVNNTTVEVPDIAKLRADWEAGRPKPEAPVETPKVEPTKAPDTDIAKRYAQAMAEYDNGRGYFDDEELDLMSKTLANDIKHGLDLAEYIETLEENIEDADNPKVAAELQALVDELNAIQNGEVIGTLGGESAESISAIQKSLNDSNFKPITYNIGEDTYILSKSTRPGEKWQLSNVADTGEFMGHSAFATDDELLEAIAKTGNDIKNLNFEGTSPDVFSKPTVTINDMLANSDQYSLEDFERAFRTWDHNADLDGATKEDLIESLLANIEDEPEVGNVNVKVSPEAVEPTKVPATEASLPTQSAGGGVPPVPPEGGDKVRSFSKRGSQDETLPDEIRNTLSEDYYRVVHNADVEAKADSLFIPDDLTQTRSNLDRAVKSHDPASALLSYKLAKAYVDNGDYDAATDVLENVSAELTRMGQFTQAAKLAMLQNDPMAAMRSYMRDLEKLNEWGSKKYKGKWEKLELSKEDIDAISKIQKGDKEALNAITDQLNEKFAKKIPANLWDKAVALSKTNMLLNLRTQGRNIIANKAMLPVRSMSDRVSAIGQNIAHLINPDIKVTQSLVGGTKEQKGIAEQIFNSMKESILGENKMKDSVKSDILSQRQIFNDDFIGKFIDSKTNGGLERLNQKLGGNANKSTLETLQNFTYWLMGDFGDTPYVKQNFVNRLASYMKAQGINKIEDVPDDAIAIATEEALKATFKDDNAFSKALMGTKQKWGKFGEVALPFVKTPANLAMRAIDYSPAGLINTIKKARNGADASRVIDELAKNLTGTAMIYLGYKLREKGLLSGNYSDNDNEKAWQKQHGMLENALHIGDNYYTIDWAQPTVTPMILGSVLFDAISNSDEENAGVLSGLNSAYKAGISVADSWLQTSPLQSLTDILGGNSYSGQSVAENIANEVIEFPQRFLPAQMGAAARTIDPVIRDTYSKDMSLTGILGNQARSAMAKVPGLSDNLPASYDTWGNERTRSDTKGEAFFAQNLNPGQLGNNNPTPLDAEIQRIYDATGNAAVFPLNADRSLDLGKDGKITLTNKQHSDYQRIMGQRSYSYAESIMNSADFKNLSDDDKASVLGKAFKLSNDLTKEELFNHVTDNDKNLKEVARSGDANAVAKYLLDKAKADNLGMSIDKYQKLESEAPGSAEQWMQDKDEALNLGFTNKDGTANVEAYEKAVEMFGNNVPALQSYQEYKSQGFTKNAQKIPYLMENNAFTDEQKGMILAGSKTYDDLGKTAKGAYDIEGYAGLYYFYLLKQLADQNVEGEKGYGSITKAERDALLNSDNPYVTALSDDMYYYLAKQSW